MSGGIGSIREIALLPTPPTIQLKMLTDLISCRTLMFLFFGKFKLAQRSREF